MYGYVIIDDESLIRKGTIKKLSSMPEVACIGEAENGREGIEKIGELHPDFVILDMQMPVMDGTQLLPYLAEHYPKLPLIVISGYKDFDYLKHAISAQAVDYILKPFGRDAIQECVGNAIARLENLSAIHRQITNSEEEKEAACYDYDIQLLKNLIMGYRAESASVTSRRLNFINETHNMALLTIRFSRVPDGPGRISDHADGTSNDAARIPDDAEPAPDGWELQAWLDENGFGDLALYLDGNESPQMGFLIVFMPESGPLSHRQLISQVTEVFLEWFNGRPYIPVMGVSLIHEDLKDLHAAFLESSGALNRQPLNDSAQSCYFYSGKTEPKIYVWPNQEEFLFRVEAAMADEVRSLFDDLFAWMKKMPQATLEDAKYYCFYLSSQCQNILSYYLNQGEVKSGSNSMQNVVNHIFSLGELKNYYLQFFLNISEMLATRSVYASDDVVEKIKIYMERNYQKNLTQEFISCLFHLNRSYLSTLFKAKTGMKFVDYLNEIRIEKAKEILRGSERKMYQIAKAVGYYNVKYFFRVFKKKEGVTPEQYRERCCRQEPS